MSRLDSWGHTGKWSGGPGLVWQVRRQCRVARHGLVVRKAAPARPARLDCTGEGVRSCATR